MKLIAFSLSVMIAATSMATAGVPASKRLTPKRVVELTAPSDSEPQTSYKVSISSLSYSFPFETKRNVPATCTAIVNGEGTLEYWRELRFPIDFEPPKAEAGAEIVPTTPSNFETANIGWTIHLTAKPMGKLISLYGVADYVNFKFVRGGYGPLSGPIYADDGKVITPNKLDQPVFQTTTTRFHIFAVPGEAYEVTLYRGEKAEKHTVTITPQ
jgi:hypothetical protein